MQMVRKEILLLFNVLNRAPGVDPTPDGVLALESRVFTSVKPSPSLRCRSTIVKFLALACV